MDRLNESSNAAGNILIVDDTPGKLLTYEVMLAELGAPLLKASSADAAFQVLLKTDVALVLTDVNMPTIDGFEFARLLHEHPRFQTTPILFISANPPSQPELLKGYASGAVDYMAAPIIPDLLRAKVRIFLELYRKQRELERLSNELEARVAARTAELQQSEERYRRLVDHATDIVATLDLEFRFTTVNPAVERILGYTPQEIIGRPLGSFVPEDQLPMHKAMLERKLKGESSTQYEMQLLGKDRRRFTLEVNSKLMFDEDGAPTAIHSISRDITERKQAEARQIVLIRELQHRSKNLLAIMQSIATNTLARSRDLETARSVVIGRLHALARAQEFVVSGATGGVPLHDLLDGELSAFGAQAAIEGSPLLLGGPFAQHFALVIHELATNAAKYGSLSTPLGRLLVQWEVKNELAPPVLVFRWTERDGPRVKSPKASGFGTQLIAASLGTKPHTAYTDEGFEFAAEIPLAHVTQASKENLVTAQADRR
jgi:PAS domain S-box-containing protein